MKRILPPLNALKVFDEAARHGCFKEAADSLFVTQSAVSKQIQRLESCLGVPLFDRKYGGAQLTQRGRDYYDSIHKAMDIIEYASGEFVQLNQPESLGLIIPHSMGLCWMQSKMKQFCQEFPSYSIRISCDAGQDDCLQNEVDAAIVCKKTQDNSSQEYELLFEERLLYVASPASVETYSRAALQSGQSHSFIRINGRPSLWQAFFDKHNIDHKAQDSQLSFQHFHMAQRAVEAGLGAGLLPDYLCSQAIKDGTLVNIANESCQSGFAYYLQIPKHKVGFRKVKLFAAWLKEQLQQD